MDSPMGRSWFLPNAQVYNGVIMKSIGTAFQDTPPMVSAETNSFPVPLSPIRINLMEIPRFIRQH